MAVLVAAGRPMPAPILARALIDTGADVTCCAAQIFHRLGISPIQQHTTQTLSGPLSIRLFEVGFSIPAASTGSGLLLVLPQLVVMEFTQPLQNIEVLIGLDVLMQCVLQVDGPNRQFAITAWSPAPSAMASSRL
jgi:hypothetical protein